MAFVVYLSYELTADRDAHHAGRWGDECVTWKMLFAYYANSYAMLMLDENEV